MYKRIDEICCYNTTKWKGRIPKLLDGENYKHKNTPHVPYSYMYIPIFCIAFVRLIAVVLFT